MRPAIGARVRQYYDGKLKTYGATPAGVDWNSRDSQELRFRELARLWEDEPASSILDYGCGYGALAVWLRARGHSGPYTGFDVSAGMAAAGEQATSALADCRFTATRLAVDQADYAAASGIFNVKLDTPTPEWHDYVLETLDDLASLGRKGFAFNVLSLYSDADRRRPDLFYADPLELFDHCRRTYSRRAALLHDYPLYEFTLLVRF